MENKTSTTHPIRVDFVPADALGLPGRLGMTFAPGKQAAGLDGRWERDLGLDLARLRDVYGATLLVSLVEDHELDRLGIADLVPRAEALGVAVARWPIVDGGTPSRAADFAALVERVLAAARAGATVVVHCRGGLGRTGLLAAACLVAVGRAPADAIAIVRAARPGAVENEAQERYVEAYAAGR